MISIPSWLQAIDVVTMRGFVFDEWDLRAAKRIARRIPGVKHVIDDREIELGGE
jgi:osmotically-inducible protein OsmY